MPDFSSIATEVKRPRGRPPIPVVEYPNPLWEAEAHPIDFHGALDMQMRRHGEPAHRLHRAIKAAGGLTDRKTIFDWRRGTKTPQTPTSLKVIDLIERRYRLPERYLRSRLNQNRAITGLAPAGVEPSESRRLAWHLPDDFQARSARERNEILAWVRTNVLTGGTAYSRYHAVVSKHRFSLRFGDDVIPQRRGRGRKGCVELVAPPQIQEEMAALIRFKSATLTDIGYQRSGVWGQDTAAQRGEHLALLFGSLAAPSTGPAKGFGASVEHLSFAHLVCPGVWDWYVQWRERRRGFFTGWEAEMLLLAAALTREKTGWLRQSSWLADRLVPIHGPDQLERGWDRPGPSDLGPAPHRVSSGLGQAVRRWLSKMPECPLICVRSMVYSRDVRLIYDSDLTARGALFRLACLKWCRKIQSSRIFDSIYFSFIINGTEFSRSLGGYQRFWTGKDA